MSASHKDAFGQFYKDNLLGLRRYIARLIPGSPEADDIANEAFSRVFVASTDDRLVPHKAYLFAAARNLVTNHHRWGKVRGVMPTIDELGESLADDTPDVERVLIARQRLDLLWEALEQLPPRTKQVFVMRKIERLSNPEIAERLNISVSLVEKLIRKGLRTCRAYLDEREDYGTSSRTGCINGEDVNHG